MWQTLQVRERRPPWRGAAQDSSNRGLRVRKTWRWPGARPLPWPSVSAAEQRPVVLFVEDERSILEPFSRALAREGFDPVPARTVAEALAAARERPPDVVLLDVMLPDGDGRDVLRELRRTSEVPVIMLTARGTETDRVVGLEIGADDYVVKPFSGAEVIARIRAVLRRTRSAPPAEAPPAAISVGPLTVEPAARRVQLEGS